ncbi:hypothetical protein WJX73_006502 [Symbiochloris irregularis]|uniref:Uncharacterized protein n=1 Tax=Symbiochloris irregularis TaxID=706552 RepID=A0AAW1P7S5_9CHLO
MALALTASLLTGSHSRSSAPLGAADQCCRLRCNDGLLAACCWFRARFVQVLKRRGTIQTVWSKKPSSEDDSEDDRRFDGLFPDVYEGPLSPHLGRYLTGYATLFSLFMLGFWLWLRRLL